MSALTVVFTGLIIFDSGGTVHLVNNADHNKTVTVGAKSYSVTTSLNFRGLVASAVTPIGGFELPALARMTSSSSLSVKPNTSIKFDLQGGTLEPYGEYAVCTLNQKPMLFWQGQAWKVTVDPAKAKLTIDGKELAMDNSMTVIISNDYKTPTKDSHLHLYALALDGRVSLYPETCEGPYPIAKSATRSTSLRRNNPITCPPVKLN